MAKKDNTNAAAALFANLQKNTEKKNEDKKTGLGIFEKAHTMSVEEIDLDKIDEFPDHPFLVLEDEAMERLRGDIREHGVHTPVQLQESPTTVGRYITLAGHRRIHACRSLGMKKIKAIIMNVSEEEAVRIMVTSNLDTRDQILPSEKAHAYRMLHDAEKADERKTADEIGHETGESKDTVKRYIRLSYLIPELLEDVDKGLFGYASGSDISFLAEDDQIDVAYYVKNGYKLDGKKAKFMKDNAKAGKLSKSLIEKIMVGTKSATKKPSFSLKSERIKAELPADLKRNQTEGYIVSAVKLKKILKEKYGFEGIEDIEQYLSDKGKTE